MNGPPSSRDVGSKSTGDLVRACSSLRPHVSRICRRPTVAHLPTEDRSARLSATPLCSVRPARIGSIVRPRRRPCAVVAAPLATTSTASPGLRAAQTGDAKKRAQTGDAKKW